MPNIQLNARALDAFNGPQLATMEYIDMKRLATVASIGLAGTGRPPADRNRATTTSTAENVATSVPTQPPIFIRVNTEFCTVAPSDAAFVTLGDPTLVGSTIAYEGFYNADGKVSFRVVDASGTAEIKMTETVTLERTYAFTFVYAFDPVHDTPPANKSTVMGILVQGRLVPTTIVSDSAPALPFTEFGFSTPASFQLTSAPSGASLMCNCGSGTGNCWGSGNSISTANFSASNKATVGITTGAAVTGVSFGTFSGITIQSGMSGDPHLRGFNGEEFFFNGEWDKWFNLLSAPDVQMNGLFTYWHTSGEENLTAMRKFGIQMKTLTNAIHRVELDASGNVILDGNPITDKKATIKHDDFNLRVNDPDIVRFAADGKNFNRPEHINVMDAILVENYNYMIYVTTTTDNINDPALDVRVDLKKKLKLHGVIGQTSYYLDHPPRKSEGLQGEGIIEGTHLDYIVSDIWGTDFKYNRF